SCEIISFAERAVDAAGNLRGMRAIGRAATTTNQDHEHNFRMNLIGVGDVPAETATERFIVARTSFAEREPECVVTIRVVAATRSAVHYGGEHALTEVRQQRG